MKNPKIENKYKIIYTIADWFSSWKFPVFALSLITFFSMMLAIMLVLPVSETPMGQFIKDFKVWCFGYKPEKGTIEWIYVIMLFLDPALIFLIIYYIWKKQIFEIIESTPKSILPYSILALFLVLVAGVGFTILGSFEKPILPPGEFPGNRIRIKVPMHGFTFKDQYGKEFNLSSHKGKVIILTAFYTSCGKTCPKILWQLKSSMTSAIKKMKPNQSEVIAVALTLDPKNDNQDSVMKTAKSHGIEKYPFYFLHGGVEAVEDILKLYTFEKKTTESGEIDHSNIFILIDKSGNISFKLVLSEVQKSWLEEAILLLWKEQKEKS